MRRGGQGRRLRAKLLMATLYGMSDVSGKMVLMHGLSKEEAILAMRAVKTALGTDRGVAFAMSTETNMTWKVSDLVEHVLEEHEAMTGGGDASKS